MSRLFRRNSEKGASLVEFAIVLPILLTLVFGIMEAGWLFGQVVEVNNAVREGARLAVVDYGTATEVANETCARADLSGGAGATIDVTRSATLDNNFDPPQPESVTVTMTKNYESLTGYLDFAFGSLTITSNAEMRTERELTMLTANASGVICP